VDLRIEYFQNAILRWFSSNGRYFPWRKASVSNYEIIISEVLLQRTKAESVANFYPRFIKKYPSWKSLGEATEIELQEFLKPIGLYRQRGTRLFGLSQEMRKRKGVLPKTRDELEEIPMMGQYIANAFELFILKKPMPLLDVNMARVCGRFFGLTIKSDIRFDKELQELTWKIINHPDTKELNWGILDFGSLICHKRKPLCRECIIFRECNYPLK
jgi:A/G-specific adenine glycosylase